MGFTIAFVVGHFFLFCNVFRLSRGLEMIWAVAFIFVMLKFYLYSDGPGRSLMTIALWSLTTTVFVVFLELRKPSYHGTGWSRINPNLRRWWDETTARQVD